MAYTSEEKEEIFNRVFEGIAEDGESLRSVLMRHDMPSRTTFFEWIKSDLIQREKFKKYLNSEKHLNNIKCRSNPKGSKANSRNDYRVINARKSNKLRYPVSNLYLLKLQGIELYKIGVSQNVDRRFRDIENAMPFNLELLENKQVPDAYDLEEFIHSIFSFCHLKSEWFALNKKDLDDVKLFIEEWRGKCTLEMLKNPSQLKLI